MNLQFANPKLLLLLLLLIPLAWAMLKLPRPSITAPSVAPFRKAAPRRRRLTLFNWCVLLTAALIIVALSRPRIPQKSIPAVRPAGVDMVLALDMSTSMEMLDRPNGVSEADFVRQIQYRQVPDRITAAKKAIAEFIEKRPNDRIGLIGFANMSYSFIPPTLDHRILLERLNSLRTGELGNSTGIASPIGMAVKRLKNSSSPRRVLVLFTDGQNTVKNRLTPQEAAKIAKDDNIIIYTVGIGSDRAYAIADTFAGKQLIRAENVLDENLLQELAKITGGSYFPATDANGMEQVMQQIDSLEKTERKIPEHISYREFAPLLAWIAAALLLLGIATEIIRKPRLP